MSRFKDMAGADLAAIINPDEFGELHNVNGNQILAVIDTDVLKERAGYSGMPMDGVYAGRVVVFIKSADLPGVPPVGSVFRLDGKLYLVIEAAETMGLLEITLEANET